MQHHYHEQRDAILGRAASFFSVTVESSPGMSGISMENRVVAEGKEEEHGQLAIPKSHELFMTLEPVPSSQDVFQSSTDTREGTSALRDAHLCPILCCSLQQSGS